ncbi:MAG: DUF3293 domain-containing protein [Rhodanobacter sp.]
MDETLLDEYRASTYLVCVDKIQWPTIRLGEPLPPTLQACVGNQAWAFITAWNPASIRRPDAPNEAAQRELLRELDHVAGISAILPAIGIGPTGWFEPSLFVVGTGFDVFDALATAYRQNAYVRGQGASQASLHVLCP